MVTWWWRGRKRHANATAPCANGPGTQVGIAGIAMAEVSRIAGEQFVTALASEHDRHVLRGQPRQRPGGQHARIAEGLVHARRPFVQRLGALTRHS